MSLKHLLDTNICIYILKKKPPTVIKKFESLTIGEVAMSVITYGELIYGAHKSNNPKKALTNLEVLQSYIPALPLPINACECYGKIRSNLSKKGITIGANDLWIAAHAKALDITLVTNNQKEFKRIAGLSLTNWV